MLAVIWLLVVVLYVAMAAVTAGIFATVNMSVHWYEAVMDGVLGTFWPITLTGYIAYRVVAICYQVGEELGALIA